MGGGGKKKEEKVAPATAPVFDTRGFQGPGGYQQFQNQGYQPTPQTFTQAGRPSWMQGHFAMPSWGMRADDPTQQVTPAMLDPRTAMFAQRDAYNAIGNQQAQQALGDGSVQDALARYAGQSSMMQPQAPAAPQGFPMGSQIPAMGGKGNGIGMQVARAMSNQLAANPGGMGYAPPPIPTSSQGG